MVKKVILGGTVALLGMGLLVGHEAASYVRTTAGYVKQSVADSVPVEFEIERARKMIDDLEPEVRRNKHLIVKEEVALEQLARQIERLEQKQQQEQANLMRMRAAVASGGDRIELAGHTYAVSHVRADMVNRFERFKTNDQTLLNLRRVHAARDKSLTAARKELEQMLAARGQLMAEVAKLEARQKMVSVAESCSEFNLDTSVLARAKELIRNVEGRLEVTERLLATDVEFVEEIPLDPPAGEDVVQEIAEYFGHPRTDSLAAEIDADRQL